MHILVVDDDPSLRDQLSLTLRQQQYQVDTAPNGEAALDKLCHDAYDLVLLDIMMPGLDGMAVLREMRRLKLHIPVLMLSARGATDDRVQGLDQGADDYLAKPFSMAELLARIRSLLRRQGSRDPVMTVGHITLDTVSRAVTNSGQPVPLTSKEFAILEFLFYNRGRAVSRFNLAEHVWGDDFDLFTMSNFIDVHMKNLRKKTADPAGNSIIRTIRGIGYIIDGPP